MGLIICHYIVHVSIFLYIVETRTTYRKRPLSVASLVVLLTTQASEPCPGTVSDCHLMIATLLLSSSDASGTVRTGMCRSWLQIMWTAFALNWRCRWPWFQHCNSPLLKQHWKPFCLKLTRGTLILYRISIYMYHICTLIFDRPFMLFCCSLIRTCIFELEQINSFCCQS